MNVNDLNYIISHWPHLLIMIGAFLIYGLLLNQVLFKPVTRILEAREQSVKSSAAAVETVKAEEARQVAAFEAALADARRKGAEERERLKHEALKAADELKEKARAETKAALEMARGALTAEAGMAQDNLHKTASELALKMLSTVLRRKVA